MGVHFPKIIAASHAGMTNEAFLEIVGKWLAEATHPRFERPYTELIYQPMLEVMEHMRDNGFKTFIVSGGGIEFMRPWTERTYGIPPEQVVGSSGVTQYVITFVSSWSRVNTVSGSPSQSLQVRNFSTIHASSPAGESLSPTPTVCGFVPCSSA